MTSTINVFACYTVKIYTIQTPKKFQTGGGGGGPGAPPQFLPQKWGGWAPNPPGLPPTFFKEGWFLKNNKPNYTTIFTPPPPRGYDSDQTYKTCIL